MAGVREGPRVREGERRVQCLASGARTPSAPVFEFVRVHEGTLRVRECVRALSTVSLPQEAPFSRALR